MKWFFLISVCALLTGCGDSFLLNDDSSSDLAIAKPLADNSYPKLGLKADLTWSIGPNLDEPNTLIYVVTDANNQISTEVLKLEAFLRMPGMSHGAYPITIKELRPGVYELSEIIFFMPDLWHLTISLTTAKGTEKLVWPYTL